MKILIMVLSSLNKDYYSILKKQQETWDSVNIEGVKTVYYYGGGEGFKTINSYSREFGADVVDDFNMMHWKFLLTLREVIKEDWDYIFRTNTSSYVDKTRLLEFAKTLPNKGCYCGITGDGFASGAGFFISRDCAEILLNEIKEHKVEFEDVYIGQIFSSNGISVTPGAGRFDFFDTKNNDINNKVFYHFRCTNGTTPKEEVINVMDYLFHNIRN